MTHEEALEKHRAWLDEELRQWSSIAYGLGVEPEERDRLILVAQTYERALSHLMGLLEEVGS